jgi:hypothetical protein
MSLKLKDEKSNFTLLLCFAYLIDSYFARDVEEVMTSTAKVITESMSDSNSQLVVRIQIYCCNTSDNILQHCKTYLTCKLIYHSHIKDHTVDVSSEGLTVHVNHISLKWLSPRRCTKHDIIM